MMQMNKKTLDQILASLANELGEFTTQIVIGGGVALLIYRNYFTVKSQKNYPFHQQPGTLT
jgi:hypothetical protein